MSNSIEIEKKALVSENDYKKFIKYFNVSDKDFYCQTNYYLETKDFDLIKDGIFLRIRKLKDEFQMTLKAPLNEGLLEKTQMISKKEFDGIKEKHDFPKGYIKDFLPLIDIDSEQLLLVTCLTTLRVDIPYKSGLLSLDKNTYSGKTDYEIELEYNSEEDATKELTNLFKNLKINFVENKKSKTLRALLSSKK